MITTSAFKAFPELPNLAINNGIGLELTRLIDRNHYDNEFIDSIKTYPFIDKYNSAHGPFYDLIPPSSDREIRDLCKTKFLRAIDACEQLGIQNIIFHTGWLKDFYSDKVWIENSIVFWNDLLNSVNNINIYIENVFEPRPELINEIVLGVNKNNFKACLDVGHVNLVSSNISNWIKELNSLIGHVHLHNNFGKEDNHNGLLQGNINIIETLNSLKEHCPNANWNLEIRNNFQESFDLVNKYTY